MPHMYILDCADGSYYREKQVQGWSRRKKQALIEGDKEKLVEYSRNYTQHPPVASTSSATGGDAVLLPSTGSGSGSSSAIGGYAVLLPEPVEGSGIGSNWITPKVSS